MTPSRPRGRQGIASARSDPNAITPRVAWPDDGKPILARCRVMTFVVACAVGLIGLALGAAPRSGAAPAPEVEYLYNVAARRHFSFPGNDALGYGHGICDKVAGGQTYAQVMNDAKRDIMPNDEAAVNYVVSYAVNLLCPAEIWQLRNSAAQYQPPPG